jgi:hypothetical protein
MPSAAITLLVPSSVRWVLLKLLLWISLEHLDGPMNGRHEIPFGHLFAFGEMGNR